MGRKCSVPGCKSSSQMPVHKLPMDADKAENWLRAINRSDLIGASKEELAKLRICAGHFSEDMVLPYGVRRRLIDNAVPTIDLPLEDIMQHGNVNENFNLNDDANLMENVPHCSNFVPNDMCEDSIQKKHEEKTDTKQQKLQRKIRTQRKMLYKKKRIICNQRKEINRLRHQNKWEEISKNMPQMQKIFIEMLTTNLQRAPQISYLLPINNVSNNKTVCNFELEDDEIASMTHNITDNNLMEEGHRYSEKHKALALTLYKTMGKRAYTCLRHLFPDIPSIQTLRLALRRIPVTTGLNTFILRHLENMASKMSMKDKVCILMWDEVSIQPKVTYDIRKDIICGLEDWGTNRTARMADHALVFMLRGLHSGWKMPISYNFCDKQTNRAQLVRCIKETVYNVNNVGFHIVATVCDQGTSNVAAIKELLLRSDMKRNFERRTQSQTFEVANNDIVPLFDPPHLIKGIRNNLLTKDLALKYTEIPQKVASWDIIKTAWIMDREMNKIRPQLRKITAQHIMENKIKKMRVKHAVQVLSGTMASYIETLVRFKCAVKTAENNFEINEEEGLATAEMINFYNSLFDSVNGSEKEITHDNELRCPVTEDSAHHAFWVSAKNILRDMKYVNKITCEIINKVPTLANWLFTIDGFQKIWKTVHCNYNFQKFNTRFCNQDPLENFFGLIRSHAVRHTNPTPQQFKDSFITLLVSNMTSISIISGNCEATDDSFMLFSLEECLKDNLSYSSLGDVVRKDNLIDEPLELISDNIIQDDRIVASLSEHISIVIDFILKEIKYCPECDASFRSSEFLVCARQLVSRINKLLKTRSHRRDILKVILQCLDNFNIDLSWHECIEHHANIFKIIVRVISVRTIIWWCERKNQLLNLSDTDMLQCEAEKDVINVKRKRALYKEEKCKRKRLLEAYKDERTGRHAFRSVEERMSLEEKCDVLAKRDW